MFTVYVEKKEGFRTQEERLKREWEAQLGFCVEELRLVRLYYTPVELSEEEIRTLFCDPGIDEFSFVLAVPEGFRALRVEPLRSQFDQQAFWMEKCLEVIGKPAPVSTAMIYMAKVADEVQWQAIQDYIINPVETKKVKLDSFAEVKGSAYRDLSFETISLKDADLNHVLQKWDLALSVEDMEEIRSYFLSEGRQPNWSELKFLETFWSDHCRHTTFNTILEEIDLSVCGIESAKKDFSFYEKTRKELTEKPVTLMDLAVFSTKWQKHQGNLGDLEESEEINAASIYRRAGGEDILLMFKNETHNHPTEIEPFGGAATCLGGAIRDPLSGRSYVYQSMRLTGARDPRDRRTLEGKLPQMTLCRRAAEGFSSYANQIGLPAGCVQEFYHPGFEAKRMEAGFVIAAARKSHVTRGTPAAGDLLLLVGGKTGRDGIGGASGSSKSHDETVVEGAASEVQKGNAPEERKLVRFFRDEGVGPKIVRCNDMGAGGIGVAFGEIAPGLSLSLDHVPVKSEDIHPWEVLLSESQERMALVIRAEDRTLFEETARRENLTFSFLGEVTDEPRFIVKSQGRKVIDLSREFLSSSGAERRAKARPQAPDMQAYPYCKENVERDALRYASLQGLSEMFDSTAGSLNVFSPYGGKYQKTPLEGMVSLIPVGDNSEDVSIATWGYDPHLAEWSPYHGAQAAVLLSLLRALALGSDIKGIRFTFQEYFERLGEDPKRWGKPLMALLGANSVLNTFSLASIGGKDSMSGSYLWEGGEICVPPTLISFAVNTAHIDDVISPEWKRAGSHLYLLPMEKLDDYSFDLAKVKEAAEAFLEIKKEGILSASVVEGSLRETLLRSAFGNGIGAEVRGVGESYGSLLIESEQELSHPLLLHIGRTNGSSILVFDGSVISLKEALKEREATLSDVYELPSRTGEAPDSFKTTQPEDVKSKAEVKVLIPVFPGTTEEDDVARVFTQSGAEVEIWVFRDQSMEESMEELSLRLGNTDILALVGGYSSGHEPDGSVRFIESVFRNERVKDAFHSFQSEGGMTIGIGNGFSALLRLGVFYDGKIISPEEVTMGLALNKNGRHQSMYVDIAPQTDRAPWMMEAKKGMVSRVPVSHAEGRFYASDEDLSLLARRGQIASVYLENPNGSAQNIEGLISPCGRIIGRATHDERLQNVAGINVGARSAFDMFASAVKFLKGKK
ncbi:MAG: phosphoribosylformylglycinamidine synthase [Tissierellia bacterium]|nr:phosphoribosylformylglycinamidine synthase [Bacillota bacterium]NLL23694.1 phosphoribosylformylglycinamidine synthase [Tissierellia bacterium]